MEIRAKLTLTLLVLSLAGLGSACSNPVTSGFYVPPAQYTEDHPADPPQMSPKEEAKRLKEIDNDRSYNPHANDHHAPWSPGSYYGYYGWGGPYAGGYWGGSYGYYGRGYGYSGGYPGGYTTGSGYYTVPGPSYYSTGHNAAHFYR